MRQFEKYKANLSMVTSNHDGYDYITSYGTKVGKVDWSNRTCEVLGYWSMTTSKHVNYACRELGLTQIKGEAK